MGRIIKNKAPSSNQPKHSSPACMMSVRFGLSSSRGGGAAAR